MLIHKQKSSDVIWGVWKIEEDISVLLSLLEDTAFSIGVSSSKRLLELSSVRVLLKALIGEEKEIVYSSNGKPYLRDKSYEISISHTRGYAAIIMSNTKIAGIDIEHFSEKVKKVRTKFISEHEFIDEQNETLHLLLHWSAKETMYKALGQSGVDLKKHLFIEKFTPSYSGTFRGYENFSLETKCFEICYFINKDYVLTFTY